MIDSNNMQITLAYNLIDISHEQLILMNVSIKENKYKCLYICLYMKYARFLRHKRFVKRWKKCLFAERVHEKFGRVLRYFP